MNLIKYLIQFVGIFFKYNSLFFIYLKVTIAEPEKESEIFFLFL